MKQEIALTVDMVVLDNPNNNSKILLIKRKNEPYKDKWALPGGFLDEDELIEIGAKRELQEETGLQVDSVRQIGVFDKVDRDPRGRTISIAFLATAPKSQTALAADDAADAKWFSLNDLPALAFDHKEIIEKAMSLT